MTDNHFRWGILGTGGIAQKFATELAEADNAVLVATASRDGAKASAFANRFGGEGCAGYESLLARQDVDGVYISLPNALHCEWSVRTVEAGKHALCEKPIAANSAEAAHMFDAAEKANRRLVEAFMYRQHPAIEHVLNLVHTGSLGEIKIVRANFTFNRQADPNDIRYQPTMAGGSLMDVGCYCLNFTRAVAGKEPSASHVFVHRHETGVDDYAVGALDFDGKLLATFTCGMTIDSDRTAVIAGTEGCVVIPDPWFCDGNFQIIRQGRTELVSMPAPKGRYALEAEELARLAKTSGPPVVTKADTLGNIALLDTLRRQCK